MDKWEGMLEKSWPEISKGSGKEPEVFSASDVPDSVKESSLALLPAQFFIEFPAPFRYVCAIIRFQRLKRSWRECNAQRCGRENTNVTLGEKKT